MHVCRGHRSMLGVFLSYPLHIFFPLHIFILKNYLLCTCVYTGVQAGVHWRRPEGRVPWVSLPLPFSKSPLEAQSLPQAGISVFSLNWKSANSRHHPTHGATGMHEKPHVLCGNWNSSSSSHDYTNAATRWAIPLGSMLYFQAESLTKLKTVWMASVAQEWYYRYMLWALGSELRSSCLYDKHFMAIATSPQLLLQTLKKRCLFF